MDELLTVNQVRSILKVDRQTVYRMLKDRRLNGVKIGHEWRFSLQEVDNLLTGLSVSSASLVPDVTPPTSSAVVSEDDLPMHCVQLIQQVFVDVAEIGALTISPAGEPLTEVSNPCKFCRLMLASPSGRRACGESWQTLGSHYSNSFATCHAGLQYSTAPIELDGKVVGKMVGGQFYAKAPSKREESARIRSLSEKHNIDHTTLGRAAAEIHVLDERERDKMQSWLKSVVLAIVSIGHERADLVSRLRSIASISGF